MLVHASGGSEHTAANVRHVHHFEQALNRAILTVRTMQYRKHGVHVAKRSQRAVIFTSEETILAECHIQHHIFGGIRLLHHRQAFAHVPLAWILATYDPLAVLGDSHLNGFELVSIQRAQHARRRDAGNRMLVALPPYITTMRCFAIFVLCSISWSVERTRAQYRLPILSVLSVFAISRRSYFCSPAIPRIRNIAVQYTNRTPQPTHDEP